MMPTLILAVTRAAQYYEGFLRSLNELYRQGGPAAEIALLLFDQNRMMITHAQIEAQTLLVSDPEHSRVCALFARGGAALINLLFHPRDRIRWIESGIRSLERSGDPTMKARLLNDLGICYVAVASSERPKNVTSDPWISVTTPMTAARLRRWEIWPTFA